MVGNLNLNGHNITGAGQVTGTTAVFSGAVQGVPIVSAADGSGNCTFGTSLTGYSVSLSSSGTWTWFAPSGNTMTLNNTGALTAWGPIQMNPASNLSVLRWNPGTTWQMEWNATNGTLSWWADAPSHAIMSLDNAGNLKTAGTMIASTTVPTIAAGSPRRELQEMLSADEIDLVRAISLLAQCVLEQVPA